MTLDEIDAALGDWQSKLDSAGGNLLELDDLFSCQRIKGTDTLPPAALTGATQARVLPALAAMDHLWQSLSLLTETIARARTLRKSASRLWPSEQICREIEQMLHGSSISLPMTPAPLAQRSLLTASETANAITPDALLSTMMQAFAVAKETMLAVDAAWNRLEPLLAAADHEADEIEHQAEELRVPLPTDLVAVRQKLTQMRVRVATDPLGVQTDFEAEITPPLIRARAWVTDLTRQRDQVARDQTRAHGLLAELTELNQHCHEAYTQCLARIAPPKGARPPLPASALPDLDAWLKTLTAALGQGQWKPARIGLDRWLQTAETYRSTLHTALSANQAQIEALAELRGYLASLKVKARTYQSRGVVLDPGLAALAKEAEALLGRTPALLEQAAPLISAYEAGLATAATHAATKSGHMGHSN